MNTYPKLIVSIKNFMARDDLEPMIPDFIMLAESRLNNNADFRVRKMVCKLVASITGSELALPSDYLGLRTIRQSDSYPLTPVSPRTLDAIKRCSNADRVYCELGNRIEVYPEMDATGVELFYYQRIPGLSTTNEVNWLVSQAPDVYLYGALLAATEYMRNDDRVTLWAQKYAEAVNGVISADKGDRWSDTMQVKLI